MTSTNRFTKAKEFILDGRNSAEVSAITQGVYLLTASSIREDNPRLAKAVTLISLGMTAFTIVKNSYRLYERFRKPRTYSIKINEGDIIFDLVERWLIEATDVNNLSSVFTDSRVFNGGDDITDYVDPMSTKLRKPHVEIGYLFDGAITQTMEIAGHLVNVSTVLPENYKGSDDNRNYNNYNSRSLSLECDTAEARTDVLREIQERSQHLIQARPAIYRSTQWGDWRKGSELSRRSASSVVLKEGQMDRIVSHVRTFFDNKDSFVKADIPFRTGIMLHGNPGSGKSSTALAIANELNMNVYVLSVSSLANDQVLSECFSNVPENSVLVLEDIDSVSAVKDRDKEDNVGVTMSGMLNVLDGLQSPPGVVTIMTTNRLDVLDSAIIRPGRVDLMEELDDINSYQLEGLCEYFMGFVPGNLPKVQPEDEISSAQIVGIFRKYIPDFENAEEEVVRFTVDKVLTNLEL